MAAIPANINEVLEELDGIIQHAAQNNSFLAIFAYVYRRVTAQIQDEIAQGNFEDNERMEIFDVEFANRYILAVRAFQDNRPVSRSWKIAFDCQQENLTIIQHLLMGMNAHINLDLSIAASTVMTGQKILDLKNDFNKINGILSALTNEVQSKLSNVSKLMFLLDLLGKNTDEKILDFSINKARGFAWKNAVTLSELAEEDKSLATGQIDDFVYKLSKHVKSPKSRLVRTVLRVIQYFEETEVNRIIKGLSADFQK